jgi:hypothetical protein
VNLQHEDNAMRFQQFVLALLLIFSVVVTASAQTVYHIRTDGGNAAQCMGTADAPYPGSGTAQNCAWNHPFQALPPEDSPRISGGDTLIIHAGSYKMGYGAPGAEACDRDGSFDCIMAPIPSGPDAEHPTRILGENHQNCTVMPELWGSERPWFVFNLSDASYVEVACLDITDHSSCIESHNNADLPCTDCTVRCRRDEPPYGDWASAGIYAEDSHHVTLRDVQVHGLAEKGILAGRLSDWTLERVKIIANGNAGFDGDLGEPSSNSGDLLFRNVEIAWNGCSEAYPAKTVTLNTCWGQQAGGYGDGLGTARTGGRWVFENSHIHHNTSDGLDLLYLDETGSVEVRGLIAEGNAGNQLKFSGAAQVENSVLVSHCAYFEGQPLMLEGDHCRAFGNTLSIELFQGTQVTVTNTTMTGQGDCLMVVECNAGGCDGTERVKVRNTLFAGDIDWGQPWENTCLYWHDEQALSTDPVDLDWNLVWRTKDDPCPGAHDVCGQDPLLKDASLSRFDGRLMAGSPAIDRGTSTDAPARDIQGVLRDDPPDIGAYEFGEGADLSAISGLGVFRQGAWLLDANRNHQWEGCTVDVCLTFGGKNDVPITGSWVSGKSSIGVFRPTAGRWFLDRNGNGQWEDCATDACLKWGRAGDAPVAGDWNGDSSTKVGVFRQGRWYLDANGNGQWDGCSIDRCWRFGESGDVPVTGDWDGSGLTKIGVFRAGEWRLDRNGNGQWDGCNVDTCAVLGVTGDAPIVGDWTGSGSVKIGVFRAGEWLLDANGNGQWDGCPPEGGQDFCAYFGQAGDLPVSGLW